MPREGFGAGHVVGVEQCLSVLAVILRVVVSRAWACVTGRMTLSREESFLVEMDMLGRTHSVSLRKNWRMCAWVWGCCFLWCGKEDGSRKP